jgi:hypothetical protein
MVTSYSPLANASIEPLQTVTNFTQLVLPHEGNVHTLIAMAVKLQRKTMNKHSDKLNAAPRASMPVRVSVGALVGGMLALAVLSSAAPAYAFGPEPQRKDERDSRDARPAQPRQERSGERDPRSFEARAEEHRRMLQDSTNNAEMSRRVGRMTADERRDLRRQINEAGQEVYAIPPKR